MKSGTENPPSPEVLPIPSVEIGRERALEFASHARHFEDGGDEEAVSMLALALDHPEWEGELVLQVQQNKPHVKDPQALLQRLKEAYRSYKDTAESTAWQGADAAWWSEHLPEARERIGNLVEYFHPSPESAKAKVIIVPSDAMLSLKDSGKSFHVGDTSIVMAHTDNMENMEHEFLHGIINPITEKLAAKIPQEKVVALASHRLKVEQGYGDHALSLLNEEIIRTYNECVETGKPPMTFEDFEKAVAAQSEDDFARSIKSPDMQSRMATLGVASVAQFKERAREYYDPFVKNELREKVYPLYIRFNQERAQNPGLRFEDFLAAEIETALS